MRAQELGDRAAQLARAVAVDDPQVAQLCDHRLVEEALHPADRVFRVRADDVNLARHRVARRHRHVHVDPRGRGGGRRRDDAQLVGARAKPLAADVHFRRAVVQGLDDSLESQRADDDAIPDRSTRRQARGPRRRRDGGGRRADAVPKTPLDRLERCARIRSCRSDVAGRHQARRPPVRVRRNRGRARLQRLHDGVDLAPRLAHALVDPLIEPLAERLFAIAQLLLAPVQPSLRLLDHLPFAGDQAPLVFEPLHLALDLRQVLRELRFARGALRARLLDDGRGQPEAARNLQRQAAARRSVVQAVRRSEGVRIEPESRRRHPLGRRRVRLQGVEVGRRHDHRAAPAEVVDDRGRQGAPFVRIGPAAGLVEEDQRGHVQRRVHRDDVRDVRGEGAEAFGDRLLVADVREDAAEHRDLGPLRGRDEQPRLRHHRQQPRGLERHGFPPRVRPRDHERPRRRNEEDIDRDDFRGASAGSLACLLYAGSLA